MLEYELPEEAGHDFTVELVSNFNDCPEQNCEYSVPSRAISSLQTKLLFLKWRQGKAESHLSRTAEHFTASLS